MAHYAFLDENNIVTEVIVGVDEWRILDGKTPEQFYSELRGQACVRTSYNGTIRKNYAGVGYKYDGVGFIPPQTYPSWVLNKTTYQWEAPIPQPDGPDGPYQFWDEENQQWSTSPINN